MLIYVLPHREQELWALVHEVSRLLEQFAVGAQDHVTDYWSTFCQPAEDSDVYSKLLRSISAAVTTCVYKILLLN